MLRPRSRAEDAARFSNDVLRWSAQEGLAALAPYRRSLRLPGAYRNGFSRDDHHQRVAAEAAHTGERGGAMPMPCRPHGLSQERHVPLFGISGDFGPCNASQRKPVQQKSNAARCGGHVVTMDSRRSSVCRCAGSAASLRQPRVAAEAAPTRAWQCSPGAQSEQDPARRGYRPAPRRHASTTQSSSLVSK